MTIRYRDGIAIGLIVVYTPSLAIASLLAFKHGLTRSGGWIFLITFSLARIIGAAFQLATISSPDSVSDYTAAAILNNIGFAPLELAALSFLSRLIENVNKSHKTILRTFMVKLVHLMITVGVILGIIGGVDAGNTFNNTGKFVLGSLNIAGTSLQLAAFALTILGVFIISFAISHSDPGEHRIFYALVLSLPLLLVRLIYSCLSTFSHVPKFGLLTGSPTIWLCVALLEELAVVVIYEGVGLTLKQSPKTSPVSSRDSSEMPLDGHREGQQEKKKENIGLRIVKKLIFVRLVMMIVHAVQNKKGGKNGDVEMQGK